MPGNATYSQFPLPQGRAKPVTPVVPAASPDLVKQLLGIAKAPAQVGLPSPFALPLGVAITGTRPARATFPVQPAQDIYGVAPGYTLKPGTRLGSMTQRGWVGGLPVKEITLSTGQKTWEGSVFDLQDRPARKILADEKAKKEAADKAAKDKAAKDAKDEAAKKRQQLEAAGAFTKPVWRYSGKVAAPPKAPAQMPGTRWRQALTVPVKITTPTAAQTVATRRALMIQQSLAARGGSTIQLPAGYER